MTDRPTLDVSHLPAEVRDARAPAWWGNTLFMFIETSTVLLLVASYLYLWRNYPQGNWPPPMSDRDPPLLDPVPDLAFGTANFVLMLLSVPVMMLTMRVAEQQFDDLERANLAKENETFQRPEQKVKVLVGLGVMTLVAVAACLLRWFEFDGLLVRWDDNPYGSVVWALLCLHLLYLVIEFVEFTILTVWVAKYGFGENQATDVLLTGDYWYWTVGVGGLIYGLVYWFPRLT